MNDHPKFQTDADRTATAILLIRIAVGLVFVGEGALKFIRPDMLGPGRFEKIGLPAPTFLAYGDGVAEIVCGALILVGLATRLAAVPMAADMVGAIVLTKIPLLGGSTTLFPMDKGGFWDFYHEGRLDVTMLLCCIALLLIGAGSKSLDALGAYDQPQGAVTR